MIAGVVALAVAAGLVGAVASPATAAPVDTISIASNKVLDLTFDGNLTDSSSNAAAISMQKGAAAYAAGIHGDAFNLNGSNAIKLGTAAYLQPADLTVSFWYKPNAAMGANEQVFTWSKTTYNSDGWYLTSENASTPLALSIGPSSGQPYKVSVTGTRANFFPTGEFTHVAVTYDKATKAVTFYRNGVKQVSTVAYPASGAATGVLGSENTSTKTIGYNGLTYNGGHTNGLLDDYKLYNGVATVADVVALTQENKPTFDPGTVAQGDLDNLVVDSTLYSDIILPAEGASGSALTWTSSDPVTISISGSLATVTPPESGTKTVTLTATAAYGGSEPVTRAFTVSVPKHSEADSIYLDSTGLDEVTLEDDYLENATAKTVDYLLSLDPERFLYSFYVQAGLPTTGITPYGGWERATGTRFQGHFFGHYLTALAQAYSSSTDEDVKAQLLAKLTTAVDGLAASQTAYAAANPGSAGYVSPFPTSVLPSGGNGLLVPFYNLHKVLAGLLDAHEYAPSAVSDKALTVADKFGTWVKNYASSLSNPSTILSTEYGGMNEALYELYSITKKSDHKRAAEYFDEVTLFNQLAAGTDVLNGKHANTTIPKLIGALKRYTLFMDNPDLYATLTPTEKAELPKYRTAAENFWRIVITHHTYANGGNSQSEHFHAADDLYANATNGVTSGYGENSTVEGCNEYNMLKLTHALFAVTKDVKYADYYETTFLNTIVASQNPLTGMVTYFQPMTAGYAKIFGKRLDQFWCDHGSGIESFTKLNDSIYFTDATSLWVTQFRSSTFTDSVHNLRLTQVADVPNDDLVTYTVDALDGGIAEGSDIRLRVPDWAASTPTLTVNGVAQDIESITDAGFLVIPAVDGDEISYTIPAEVTVDDGTENPNWVAFKYGPVLLATSLNKSNVEASYQAGVLVEMSTADKSVNGNIVVDDPTAWKSNIADNLKRVENVTGADGIERLQFRLSNVDEAASSRVFEPYFSLYDARYALYMTLVQPDSADAQAMILAQKQKQRIADTTIDSLTSFDNNNGEADKNHKFNKSGVGVFNGQPFRDGQVATDAWFQYEMIVDPSLTKNYLGVRYYGGDNGRTFDVYVNDVLLKTQTITNANGATSFYVQYDEIPKAVIDGIPAKDSFKRNSSGELVLDENGEKIPVVTVRFQGKGTTNVGGVFGVYTASKTAYDTASQLSRMSFSTGALSPALTAGSFSYALAVPASSTSVSLDVAPAAPSGLVYANGILIDDTKARSIPLTGPTTTVTLRGYAENHTTFSTYNVTITKVSPASVSLSPNVLGALTVGDTRTVDAAVLPSGADAAITWSTSNAAVATVSSAGVVSAVSAGTATLTATSDADPAIFASIGVTVTAPVVNVPETPAVITPGAVSISGAAKVGGKLVAAPGEWGPAPVEVAFQWLRNGTPIAGATGSTYVPQVADRSARVSVRVTGAKAGLATVVASSTEVSITAGTLTAATPKITGTAKVGKKLKVRSGTWGPSKVTLSYQWLRSGKAIKGATKSTYTVKKADRGKKLTVKVTGKKSGYSTLVRKSKATTKVR